MKKATLAIAMLTLLSFGAAQAQTHFSLRLGGAFPMGKFADASANFSTGNLNWGLYDNSKKGGAGIGVTLGGNFKYDIASVKGLGVNGHALDLLGGGKYGQRQYQRDDRGKDSPDMLHK